jgi:regulator of replication initiation timing
MGGGGMTNEQLTTIEARLARTDSKRWELEEDYVIHEDGSLIAQVYSDYSDADFIANVGKDIPALCAALRAARAETEQAWAIAKDNRERRIKAEDAQTVAESWWRYHAEGHAQKFDEAERLAAEASAETAENVNLTMENERLRHAIESAMSSLEKASGTVGRPKSIGISKVFDVYCALKEALREARADAEKWRKKYEKTREMLDDEY